MLCRGGTNSVPLLQKLYFVELEKHIKENKIISIKLGINILYVDNIVNVGYRKFILSGGEKWIH